VRGDGKFRSFLLSSLEHFLAAEWNRAHRQKRGGQCPAISLDEMHRRLMEPDRKAKRFACITCDGGYVDHHAFVHPIFRKHDAPFAIFIPTAFPDRIGELWWLMLEAVIGKTDRLALLIDGREQRIDCRTASEKARLFEALRSWLMARPTDEEISRYLDDLAARYGVDIKAICADVCMSWTQIAALAADPLVTVGAQSVNHPILAKPRKPRSGLK
jgi:peptidoglycan/xylan/chitin deacetylase (PgdA/CDA1 family)